MSYLERLDEALNVVQTTPNDKIDRYWSRIYVAARAYRDLLANGERVEWCETHRTTAVNASGECPLAHHETPQRPCRIVSRLLSDYPKEAENE